MDGIRTLLVGLALRPRRAVVGAGSQAALDQALWLARTLPARLLVVVSTFERRPWSDEDDAALEEALAPVREAGVEVEVRRTDERAWAAITSAVQAGEGQLVVVGKREAPAAEGRRLGSQAIKLLRKCPAPVWVVRPEHDLVHKLVLAATDLTPVGDAAIEAAAFVAEHHQCELHVVHAFRISMELQLEAPKLSDEEYAARLDAIKAAARGHIDAVLGRSVFDGESVVHLGPKAPHLAIREAVEHLHPDLLVMGTVSHGGRAGFLVGSTAERLLDRVDCSLLTVKPADFVCPLTPG
jgi:universal stress protein E